MPSSTFLLSSGAEIEVQTTHPLEPSVGVREASPGEVYVHNLGAHIERVADLANEAMDKLREKIKPCKEVAMEFGVSIGGKTGVILVEGSASANFKVTLKF